MLLPGIMFTFVLLFFFGDSSVPLMVHRRSTTASDTREVPVQGATSITLDGLLGSLLMIMFGLIGNRPVALKPETIFLLVSCAVG